ncbi:hypothetical protein KSP35_14035 [Aquihabitans sp. G128]|uniref:hypothetical protein n=1 Tax=Aquihabitans sp. G128 TaxID=2849779 RepID=UPI001C22608C|nr:hypothetical protein [Aquihabitans sp. G128]QXC59507.1 hypothetical protein KSP35_14035 [Aquihabitans sp. G128]
MGIEAWGGVERRTAGSGATAGRPWLGLRRRATDVDLDRLADVIDMTDAALARTEAEIRGRHPEWSDDQVQLAGVRLRVGDDVFARAHPGSVRLRP